MKKSLVWVVLVGLVLVIDSCKKDDPAPVDPLVGTWALAYYQLTGMPTGFTSYEGTKQSFILGIETGYTFEFNADGTYSRAFTVDERYLSAGANSIFDKGKYTKDGSSLKVAPTSTTDLTLIENYGGTPGTDFDIVGDITDTRLTLAVTASLYALPDSFTGDPSTATEDDYKEISCTVQMIFNKL